MLRCAELGLRSEDLENMTVGMVYDMIVEKANDEEKYPTIGKPGSLRQTLGGY